MAIISRYASCHGPLAPNSERRIVATKFAVISPKCRSRLAASGAKRPYRQCCSRRGLPASRIGSACVRRYLRPRRRSGVILVRSANSILTVASGAATVAIAFPAMGFVGR
jgi:hypothetical protein